MAAWSMELSSVAVSNIAIRGSAMIGVALQSLKPNFRLMKK